MDIEDHLDIPHIGHSNIHLFDISIDWKGISQSLHFDLLGFVIV